MIGQMSLFDFIPETEDKKVSGYWDPDINQMVALFEGWAEGRGLKVIENRFTVWTHCPQYGYRLELETIVPFNRADEIQKDIDMLISEMKSFKGIDADILVRKSYRKGHLGDFAINVVTTYKDSRAKRKDEHTKKAYEKYKWMMNGSTDDEEE